MKQISVRYIENLNTVGLENAGDILEENAVRGTIEKLNWIKEYPYKPITIFNIARSIDSIFIKFTVNGTMLRAIYSNDQEPVHEDSCVEFFGMPVGSDKYTNFEFNCIGTCAASNRKNRTEDVVRLTTEQLQKIERYPSIGRKAFNEMEGMFKWELTVKIPFELMGIDPQNLPPKMLGNFYKCANGTNSPHYLSWNPITTEKPDFHQPKFFGELIFE